MVSRIWWLLASAVVAAAPATAPDYRSLSNLDFEQGVVDSFPPGWVARGALRRGFKVALSDDQPHAGRFSALIRRDSLDWRDSGVLAKRLDARPYRGRRVRVAGWLRFQGMPSNAGFGMAGLTLQVYLVGGRDGFYGDTDNRPVRSAAWAPREVLGEVAEDADTLAFGGYLTAGGRAWMDDISLTPLGPNGEGDQPARPLTERGTENLVAFGRLLGYVRYFHPSDESAGTDWDSFAIAGVDEVEGAATPEALVATLERLFRPIAPTVRIATHRPSPLTPTMLRPAGTDPKLVTGWWHHGRGSTQFSLYYDRRPVVSAQAGSDSIATIGSDVSTSLGGGVWCSVPLSLYVDAKGTLPRGSARAFLPRRPEGWLPTGNDRATRLADVIQLWNIPQHFYPYFDVVGTDWPAQLPLALRRAAEDRDGASFEMTVRRLVAQLHDGHGSVNSPYGDPRPLPLAWDFVEGKLVVLRADSSYADRLHPGDEVTTIQGRPVTEWVKEAEPTKCAATPQWLRLRVAGTLQVMTQADTVALGVRSPAGDRRSVLLPRQSGGLRKPARPDSVTQVAPGVMYLDFDRITDADFNRALPAILRAKGVIFDLRGYPNRLSMVPLNHLTDSRLTSARWYIPLVTRPDHQDMKFEFSNWPVQPLAPRIHGRVAFLIDGRAISAAETMLGIVEHYHLADLVGEPTAGTNGNINLIDLPGGYTVTFTGMKVLKHDGSRHHGVGILPTVPVSPTIAGIAAGRDEQLEKAIEVVSRRQR